MDPKKDEDKVEQRDASSKNTQLVSERVQELRGSSSDHNEAMSSDMKAESNSSPNSNLEETTSGHSNGLEHEPVQDCIIPIPENLYLQSDSSRPPESSRNPTPKPENLIASCDRSPSARNVMDRCVDDVALNLTEFLSYAQQNNYDIVIPASRENPAPSTNLPRLGSGRGFMVLEQQHFPQGVASSTVQYPPADFVNVSGVATRNPSLAPSMYHPGGDIPPPAVDFSAPPPYEIKLPTYEEVQREKALESELVSPNAELPNAEANSSRTLSFLTIDSDNNADPESKLLGTDSMFVISFFLALALNWIGFLLLMCFCHTVASRYGALSGFGLSLSKWTIIVKHSADVSVNNAWLWWFVTAFGLMICVKALFQYIYIKRKWRTLSQASQERYLFLY